MTRCDCQELHCQECYARMSGGREDVGVKPKRITTRIGKVVVFDSSDPSVGAGMSIKASVSDWEEEFERNFVPMFPGMEPCKDWSRLLHEGATANYCTLHSFIRLVERTAYLKGLKEAIQKMEEVLDK